MDTRGVDDDERLIPSASASRASPTKSKSSAPFRRALATLAHPTDHASDVITAHLPHTLTPAAIPPHQPERPKLVRRVRASNQRARPEHAEDAGDRPGGGVVQRCQLAGSVGLEHRQAVVALVGTPRRRVRASAPGMGG